MIDFEFLYDVFLGKNSKYSPCTSHFTIVYGCFTVVHVTNW
jgi:hypothetical protein